MGRGRINLDNVEKGWPEREMESKTEKTIEERLRGYPEVYGQMGADTQKLPAGVPILLFPLAHLHRMHLVFARDHMDRSASFRASSPSSALNSALNSKIEQALLKALAARKWIMDSQESGRNRGPLYKWGE
jgi:hypothetical protein